MQLLQDHSSHEPNVVAGAASGLIGGLVGTWVMTRFQNAMQKAMSDEQDDQPATSDEDPTTVKVAQKVARPLLGRGLTPREKPAAGQLVHYGFGTTIGGMYGAAAEYWPQATAGFGSFYGAALMAGADEAALPAIGLTPPPHKVPAATHAYALGSHIVYGLATEATRRAVRRMMA